MSEEEALERLRNHEITIRQAAEIANLSYQEMFSRMAEEDIESVYSVQDLEEDVETL